MLDIERALNPEQIEAVTHGDGPQLVIAGAGSGKTRVITYRIAWLIEERKVEPWRIAAVTFTNKAASEMRERVGGLARDGEAVFVGTFHRFALRLLRRYGDRVGLIRDFVILDTPDQRSLVKEALAAEGLSDSAFPPRAVLGRISAAKNRLLSPSDFSEQADGFFDRKISPVYLRYDGLLRKAGGVDFDDLIVKAVELLKVEEELGERMRYRLRYLLVDEYQDTNFAQHELIQMLSGPAGNLTAVGDEDQSIYRWRGAELENILRFEESFPGATVRKLERNYRSTQVILDAASALVAHNEHRRGKTLWTERDGGDSIELYRASDEGDEARWLVGTFEQLRNRYRYRDMAVLVRTNAQTRVLEEELGRRKVPYCLIAGVRFYDRAEIKDLVAYLRVLRNPQDNLSMRRILNRPTRGIGKGTEQALLEEAEELGGSIWDALRIGRLAGVAKRGRTALETFRQLILALRESARALPLPRLIEEVLERSGYAAQFSAEDEEARARLENLRELLSAAQDFVEEFGRTGEPAIGAMNRIEGDSPQHNLGLGVESASPSGDRPETPSFEVLEDGESQADEVDSLTAFLDYVALVSDTDSLDSEVGVALMTFHSAKGLEFPVVAVTGLEEGLLPHFNSQDSPEDIEEERRLLYVGMTRAEERLLLSTCRRRRIAGRYQDQLESPFLSEIPAEGMVVHESPSLFAGARTDGVYRFFDRKNPRPFVEDPDQGKLRKGCRVRHATLGVGVVLDLEGSGDDAKLTVFFDRSGKRKLIARYAALEVV